MYLKVDSSTLLSFGFIMMVVCFLDIYCESGSDDFGGQNEALRDDAIKYLKALEAFDRTNSSFEALTSSIKNFFKYVDLQRQDELAALLFAFPLLRPDLFPLVQERRLSQMGYSVGKSNVLIKRKDDTFFMLFPSRFNVSHMIPRIRKSEGGGMTYKGIEDSMSHLVVVQLHWQKSDQFKNNRTLTAEFRWDNLSDDDHLAVVTQELKKVKVVVRPIKVSKKEAREAKKAAKDKL